MGDVHEDGDDFEKKGKGNRRVWTGGQRTNIDKSGFGHRPGCRIESRVALISRHPSTAQACYSRRYSRKSHFVVRRTRMCLDYLSKTYK